MKSPIEERLTRTLSAVAEQTGSVPDPHGVQSARADAPPPGSRRTRIVAAAAVVVSVIGIVAGIGFGQTSPRETVTAGVDLVLPGENVLSTSDPLIVSAAPAPPAEFNVDELGTEVTFEPMEHIDADVERVVSSILASETGATRTATKVVLIGELEGHPWLISITDGPNVDGLGGEAPSANLRIRTVYGPGGGHGVGDVVPVDSSELIRSPQAGELRIEPSYEAPVGWLDWQPLPEGTAVVTFADADQRLWMRPRGGVAAFPVQFDEGERFILEARAVDGTVIEEYSTVVGYGPGPIGTTVGPGDNVGAIEGLDESGAPVTLEPGASKATVLVFGAPWCVPCQTDIEGLVSELAEIDAEPIQIYSVPHYVDPGVIWPETEAWPYPQVTLSPDSPLKAVPTLPTIIVLDETNTIVVLQVGFDGLETTVSEVKALLERGR